MFANGYVDDLCQEQRYRHDKYFMKNPKEFRCSPEQQLQTLLSFKHGGSRQRKLREKLEKFHHELLDHCGAVKEGEYQELGTKGIILIFCTSNYSKYFLQWR